MKRYIAIRSMIVLALGPALGIPCLLYSAATKYIPWTVPAIVVPIYVIIVYACYKAFWPHIMRKNGDAKTTEPKPYK
jgi:hypothetical protein